MTHIVAGVVAILLGIFGVISWWDNFGDFLRGGVPLMLFIGGLLAIGTGLQLQGENSSSRDADDYEEEEEEEEEEEDDE